MLRFSRPIGCRLLSLTLAFLLIYLNSTNAAEGRHAMVATEGAQAAQIGLDILNRGGNAIDAAVAISLALGVTNSGSCGIGGGGFMLIYRARDHQLYALDYRETAPRAATPTMYIKDGKPVEELARTGALGVAVPGEIAGLEAARKRFGTMAFSALAAPAIKLARDGFPLSDHMALDVQRSASQITQQDGFRAQFFGADQQPLKAGATVYAKNLATMMAQLGDDPVARFYRGEIAEKIVAFVRSRGGIISADDLKHYQPIWREPLRFDYRGYQLYTMPPPSSGGVVLEILGMLADSHLEGLGFNSAPYLVQLTEVMRAGFADRDQYGDPAFINVPLKRLLSHEHIEAARRNALQHKPLPQVAMAHDHGTSNFCVVDQWGNVVDVTTTINTIFGAKIMAPELGLILNDEMDDFSVAPGVPNAFKLIQASANAVAPGKRPLSSMSPLIAMRDGKPALVAGGSGGPTIITGVVQVALDTLDFKMEAQQAVSAPRIHDQGLPPMLFVERALPAKTVNALDQMGYKIKQVPELGAVTAIRVAPGKLDGGYDPRKGGAAIGD